LKDLVSLLWLQSSTSGLNLLLEANP